MTGTTGPVRTEPLTEAAADALEARAIDLELVQRMGIESVVKARGRRDNREWIAIPHLRSGRVVHVTYRTVTGEKAFYQSKGGERCFWNEDVLRDPSLYREPLVITEGHLDALAAMTAGFRAVMSVCDGASKSRSDEPQRKYEYVNAVRPLIDKFERPILATDDDDAGAALLNDLARLIGRPRCRWVSYQGLKDINELLVKVGFSAVVEAINGARYVSLPGVYTYDDLPPVPDYPALACGKEGIDDIWRFRQGENSILTGMPEAGKTSLLNDIAVAIQERHGWVTAWFTPEQPARTTHVRRLSNRKLGLPPNLASDEERKRALDFIIAHNVWLMEPEDQDATVDWLLEQTEAVVIRHNARLIVIDPWNELHHDWPAGFTETEYIGKALKRINKAARDLGAHIIIAPHPKVQTKVSGKYVAPDGYAISGGANWYNKAVMGLSVHREDENKVRLKTWKVKFADEKGYAKRGEVALRWDNYGYRFVVDPTAAEAVDEDE